MIVAAALLLAWAVLFSAGDDPTRLAWIGGAAVVVAAIAVALLGAPRTSRAGWAFVALLAGYTAWTGLSLLWSWAPDLSWDAFNRGVAYTAIAVLGLYLGSLSLDRLCIALGAVVGVAALWALLSKVVVALDDDLERVGRLSEPVGYWNLLAFVLALGLPLALRLPRDLAAVAVYALVLAMLLTYSRGGLAAGLVALGAYVWLARVPVRPVVAVVAAGTAPAAAVFVLDPGRALFAVLLPLGAAAAYALARLAPPRVLAWAAAAIAAAGAVALVVAIGNPLDEFRNDPTEQRPGTELVTASSNNRWTWWNEAADGWADAPLVGTGAGSFELVHRRLRENELNVSDPHSLPLAALAETGLVGFLLLAGAAVAAVAAARPAARTPAGAALAAGGVAWLAHSLVDLHWDYLAATAPALLATGALAGARNSLVQGPAGGGRRAGGPEESNPLPQARPRARAFGAGLVALALVYSFAAPALSESGTEGALARIGERDFRGAASAADDARALDPLAVEPLFALARAYDLGGADERALEVYEDAVALQPENWETWYRLGSFEYRSLEELDAAFLDLDKAYALDSRNVIVQRELDEVRDTLNRGG